jgi:hypothetical protein
MKILLYSGLLYLVIIAIVLASQPTLMFTADGRWKEFGIGRNPERYTWMPFWLFAILAAILCYMFILILAGGDTLPGVQTANDVSVTEVENVEVPMANVLDVSAKANSSPATSVKRSKAPAEMKSGYYILNMAESSKKGVPKYIYLGPEPPNLIYNHGESGTDMSE